MGWTTWLKQLLPLSHVIDLTQLPPAPLVLLVGISVVSSNAVPRACTALLVTIQGASIVASVPGCLAQSQCVAALSSPACSHESGG